MRYRLILSIIWAITIAFLSLIPSSRIPSVQLDFWISADKLVHIALYAIYTFLIGRYFYYKWTKGIRLDGIIISISIIYGIIMELLQFYLSPSRFFDFSDIIANIIGSLVGLLFLKLKI